jgi:hypothetical protein
MRKYIPTIAQPRGKPFEKGHKPWNTGKKLPNWVKKKISNSHKGKKMSRETKLKKSIAMIGKKVHSEEWKQKLRERFSGKDNPCWKGGISFKPYGKLFNFKLKKLIKERDNERCLICKAQKRLMIHHINYNKNDCNPENLITLCNSCHTKTNFNREQWLTYFGCGKRKQYFLSIAQLADRLSIVTLKSIKIHENKEEYEKEAREIINDLDVIAKEKNIEIPEFGQLIRAIGINSIINEMIWTNESFVRKGEGELSIEEIGNRLQLTHALNRIRNQAMNIISNITGERKDLKLDYMDAELTKKFGYDFGGILNG